ncbi:MAG TPA: DUF922 domain-containing protein, partial [Chryseosolibacter sp.]|nr:DUF922 domain-containing protein [Chryseosolibacter sp.]
RVALIPAYIDNQRVLKMIRSKGNRRVFFWHNFDLSRIMMSMKKVASAILLLVVTAIAPVAQPAVDAAEQLLSWNEFYKIQWHDFQGEPDESSIGDAGTAVQIKARPFLVKKEINYDVVAFFNRKKSWARDRSASLLAHEQLHFDIAELYARKIRKKIHDLNSKGINNIKIYNNAIRELLLESNRADEQYDLETLHGAMSKKQAAWSAKVKEELTSLGRYKKPKRVIGQ